jgi:D-alanyl-D-alanine carboxypeptidase
MSLIPHDLHPQKLLPDPRSKTLLIGPSYHQVLGVFVVFVLFVSSSFIYITRTPKETQTAHVSSAITNKLPSPDKSAFDSIIVEAQSALVWDVKNKTVLYEKNKNTQSPLASLSKLMTALVAHDLFFDDTTVTVPHTTAYGADIQKGHHFSARDLIDYMLVVSSNSAARALADAIIEKENNDEAFVDYMNKKANELGLVDTYFLNSSGLDVDEEELPGSYGSVYDCPITSPYFRICSRITRSNNSRFY